MKLSGSICALATPFQAAGALDTEAFERLIEQQIEGGTQALVVAGSTGEAHFLEADEYDRLLTLAVKRVDGRVPVIAGTGEAGTAKTIHLTRHAADLGADAALVVTPYYVRPTQSGLIRHFTEVAEQGGLPVILYNVPTRTACDMLPETVAALRGHERIVGIKEARSDVARIQAIAELAGEDFVYLSGDDGSAVEAMLAGAAGTISVVANLVPRAFRAMCDAAGGGDHALARERAQALMPLLQALDCAPNPIPVKAGLAALGIGDGSLRLPLEALQGDSDLAAIRDTLARLTPLASAD
ncbi:4-hydroxy-tetrahydrodipicolinate synthase [Oleiagrimonas soli]|uniref:4-hydroxy-tetrahydrodipicolinate synthase n=1 Tax=Oleiagrimonas soli TaxID=1543381 RepID=A0A099CWL5_9GAMM|nr:4-hydroxy-tetrahydrodipicolinate synthase [Oleiagrimonas soli]KGI78388.1 dihydrodipicolinate synthase [Oleiagrimonas soli]MBB6183734.1 4-hydroxy-tetrahydrodipicolinate synthase [Oleiagrimonas soli]